MNDESILQLRFRSPEASPANRRKLSWRGFAIEHTRLSDTTPYSFDVTGKRHYLALHDLVLEEGEMRVGGSAPIEGRDLRNRITYMPRHCKASGFSVPAARDNSFTTFYFDPEIVSTETERIYGNDDATPMIYFEDRRLRSTLEKLRMVVTAADDVAGALDDIYVESLGVVVIVELALLQARRDRSDASKGRGLSDAQRKLVFDYIEANLASEVTLDALAGVAGLSRFHFARAFKATVGVPPYTYVLQRRIELAKMLLKATSLSVGEVASAAGFRTASHFVNAFQNATGTTPGVFRRA